MHVRSAAVTVFATALSLAVAACSSAAPSESPAAEGADALLVRTQCATTPFGSGLIKVDATNAYITGGGNIATCPTSGDCSSPTTLASISGTLWDMAIGGNNVYWSNADTIFACAKTGCGGKPTVLATHQIYAARIAADAANVYWLDYSPTAAIKSCPATGCNGAPTVLATNLFQPNGLMSDGTNVYWAASLGGQIWSCPVTGCNVSPTLFATSPAPWTNGIESLAFDANYIYFGANDPVDTNGIVARVPRGGGPITILANGQHVPSSIASDGVNVFWTQSGLLTAGGTDAPPGGSVMKCAVAGCNNAPTSLLSGDYGFPGGIAVDATSVYFGDSSGTQRLPKSLCYVQTCSTPIQCCAQNGGEWVNHRCIFQ